MQLTWTKSGIVLSPLMTILLWISLARMCSAPVQPSTISSIRTPSCQKVDSEQTHSSLFYSDHATSHRTHHKLLLCTPHGSSSLSILVGSDEQLDQSRDGTLFSERCMVGRAQSQITDQTNCSLNEKMVCFFFSMDIKNNRLRIMGMTTNYIIPL